MSGLNRCSLHAGPTCLVCHRLLCKRWHAERPVCLGGTSAPRCCVMLPFNRGKAVALLLFCLNYDWSIINYSFLLVMALSNAVDPSFVLQAGVSWASDMPENWEIRMCVWIVLTEVRQFYIAKTLFAFGSSSVVNAILLVIRKAQPRLPCLCCFCPLFVWFIWFWLFKFNLYICLSLQTNCP